MTNQNYTRRLHDIIDIACLESEYSQFCHTEYFSKTHVFDYQITYDPNVKFAYVYQETSLFDDYSHMNMVLNVKNNNKILSSCVHHELAHIDQLMNCHKYKLNTHSNVPVDDYLAMRLLQEVHAYNMQAEGPLRGLVKALDFEYDEKIDHYKDSLSDPYILPRISKFASMALQQDVSYKPGIMQQMMHKIPLLENMSCHKAMTRITHCFADNLLTMDEENREQQWINARKEHCRQFMYPGKEDKDSLLDLYVGNILQEYITRCSTRATARGLYKLNNHDDLHAPEMDLILPVFENGQDMFLTRADWHDALDADNNRNLIHNIMQNSAHKTLYKKAQEWS